MKFLFAIYRLDEFFLFTFTSLVDFFGVVRIFCCCLLESHLFFKTFSKTFNFSEEDADAFLDKNKIFFNDQ